MSLTESIMLFYREAFPMSYQFADCAPTDKATIEVPCPIKMGACQSKLQKGSYLVHADPFYYSHHRKKNFSAV